MMLAVNGVVEAPATHDTPSCWVTLCGRAAGSAQHPTACARTGPAESRDAAVRQTTALPTARALSLEASAAGELVSTITGNQVVESSPSHCPTCATAHRSCVWLFQRARTRAAKAAHRGPSLVAQNRTWRPWSAKPSGAWHLPSTSDGARAA